MIDPSRRANLDTGLMLQGALMRGFFAAFLPWVFGLLHPGQKPLVMHWYLFAMCQAFSKAASGAVRRLVINVPPRHLKSIASVAFVAWMLGRAPALKFMLVTYGDRLSKQHLKNLILIMKNPVYRALFPRTRLVTITTGELVIETSEGGGCRCVTVSGATTGFGADIIIIDDAMKADEINSEARRDELDRFYSGTLLTRLNNKRRGLIISIQQRLGEDDLPNRLIEAGAEHLSLPAHSDQEAVYDIGFGRMYRRKIGEVLRPDDEPMSVLEEYRRDMGPSAFATQYLQLPYALEGNVIRAENFARFDLDDYPREEFTKVVQSWDLATSISARADCSVCMTFGFLDHRWYLLDVQRVRVEYTELRDRIIALRRRWKADAVLIEDAGAGFHMWSDLRNRHDWRPEMIRPIADKVTRMVAQLAMIEDGDLLLPHEAPWLPGLLSEMRAFPDATHDDQVDALSQFLAWAKEHEKWALTVRDPRTGRLMRPSRHQMQALREQRTHRINSRGS